MFVVTREFTTVQLSEEDHCPIPLESLSRQAPCMSNIIAQSLQQVEAQPGMSIFILRLVITQLYNIAQIHCTR